MLVLVVIHVWCFFGGNGIPVEGTEPRCKSKIYFGTKSLLINLGKIYLPVLQFGTGVCFLCSVNFMYYFCKTNKTTIMLKLITDSAHYTEVLARVPKVKRSLWIGTADIKDLYVKVGSQTKPFLAVFAELIKKGVEVRLIHAKEPGQTFREDFDKYPALFDGLERVLCPRVHFKIIVFDGQVAYIGSANLTGAGIGMKGDGTRNFEAGILTDDHELVEQAMNQFDDVWIGKHCKNCKRKEFCGDPIAL